MIPPFTNIADYLAWEEIIEVKHEYAGGTVHAMVGACPWHEDFSGFPSGFPL